MNEEDIQQYYRHFKLATESSQADVRGLRVA